MPLCGNEWEEYEAVFGLDDIKHYNNLLCYRCFEENTWVWPKSEKEGRCIKDQQK
jgi:hypothetical protein